MKKRDLIKQLIKVGKAAGYELKFVREGANHEIWSLNNQRLIIARHTEIPERTAQGTIKDAKKAVQ